MFGYVRPDKSELKIKEFDTYKAVYCSLCKTLGSEYGMFSKALLTYDATFYVLLMKAVAQSQPDCAHQGRCRFNPLKKCNYIDGDEILKAAAALSVIMFYYKLKDDISDSGILRRLSCLLVLPYIKFKFKKAVKNYSYFDDIIRPSVERQSAYEHEGAGVDKACDPSAQALGEIFSYGIDNVGQSKALYRLGYCLGRWVYLMDAFDDLYKDVRTGSYNPFAVKYGLNRDNIGKIDTDTVDGICGTIRISANEAGEALNSLEKSCYASIVENIVFDGTENQLIKIIEDREKGKRK